MSIEVAAAIIWRKHGASRQYLAVQRPKGIIHAGWWEFPGGKIEQGEDPATALVRELTEELGIQARNPHFWQSLRHSYAATAADPARQVHIHFFHVTDFGGAPQPQEGQQLRWIYPEQGLELPFLTADLPIVHALCNQD